jgi:hypothetical protein
VGPEGLKCCLFSFLVGRVGWGGGGPVRFGEQAVRFIVAAPPTLDCRASLVSKLDQPAAPIDVLIVKLLEEFTFVLSKKCRRRRCRSKLGERQKRLALKRLALVFCSRGFPNDMGRRRQPTDQI